ncbi:MAG: hypothetical protein OEY07_07325 [Gammaproteobacteria bacterium]|nr:hypothetical protein [Gammaproteobacteria bacterium]
MNTIIKSTLLIAVILLTACSPVLPTISSAYNFHNKPAYTKMKVARETFTLNLPVKNNRIFSLYATTQNPAGMLPKLVILAPATGMACHTYEVCMDQTGPVLTPAQNYFAKRGSYPGPQSERYFFNMLHTYGADSLIMSSGRNYTNFGYDTANGNASFGIAKIDGVPVGQTTMPRLWLVVFEQSKPVYPRALDFPPAFVSVIEVEFAH